MRFWLLFKSLGHQGVFAEMIHARHAFGISQPLQGCFLDSWTQNNTWYKVATASAARGDCTLADREEKHPEAAPRIFKALLQRLKSFLYIVEYTWPNGGATKAANLKMPTEDLSSKKRAKHMWLYMLKKDKSASATAIQLYAFYHSVQPQHPPSLSSICTAITTDNERTTKGHWRSSVCQRSLFWLDPLWKFCNKPKLSKMTKGSLRPDQVFSAKPDRKIAFEKQRTFRICFRKSKNKVKGLS